MPLAADYPFLDVVWTMAIVVLGAIWIFLLFKVFTDIIARRHDMSGFVKACWLVFVMVLPILGVFVYLLAGKRATEEHRTEQA